MNHRRESFGPWTTSLDAGLRLELSTLWRRRMQSLPNLAAANSSRRRGGVLVVAAGGLLAAAPIVQFIGESRADEPAAPAAAETADDKPAADEGSDLLRKLELRGAGYLGFLRDEAGYRL